jgi:hypothetical protein
VELAAEAKLKRRLWCNQREKTEAKTIGPGENLRFTFERIFTTRSCAMLIDVDVRRPTSA